MHFLSWLLTVRPPSVAVYISQLYRNQLCKWGASCLRWVAGLEVLAIFSLTSLSFAKEYKADKSSRLICACPTVGKAQAQERHKDDLCEEMCARGRYDFSRTIDCLDSRLMVFPNSTIWCRVFFFPPKVMLGIVYVQQTCWLRLCNLVSFHIISMKRFGEHSHYSVKYVGASGSQQFAWYTTNHLDRSISPNLFLWNCDFLSLNSTQLYL